MDEILNTEPTDTEASCESKNENTNSTEEKADALLSKIEELKAQLAERDDRILRLAAEYENFRRRAREEKLAAYDGAMADTVSQILPIIDNLERAGMYDDLEKVKEGLVMIAKSIEGALGTLGVEAVGKVGDTFDPNLHNAVMHDEDESRGEGEIVEVFQKGYKKGSKIIRFAMVKTVN